MLTTRVVPTAGSAWVGAVDVVAHPALAEPLIGVVSEQNTLRSSRCARTSTSTAASSGCLAPHSRRVADALLEQFRLRAVGARLGAHALRRAWRSG